MSHRCRCFPRCRSLDLPAELCMAGLAARRNEAKLWGIYARLKWCSHFATLTTSPQLYSDTTSTILHPEADRPLTVRLRRGGESGLARLEVAGLCMCEQQGICGVSSIVLNVHLAASRPCAIKAHTLAAHCVQVRESARVQGFPDWVEFAGSPALGYKQVWWLGCFELQSCT